MAPESAFSIKQQFEALSKGSSLDVSLPKSDFNAAEDESIKDLSNLINRGNLFLDEEANVLLILKTYASVEEVERLLPSIEATVAAHATENQSSGGGPVAAKYDVASSTFPATTDVKVATIKGQTHVIWKLQLHLTRPRARLQKPSIYFTGNLSVPASSLEPTQKSKQNFLKSYESLPGNVLAPLQFDPTLAGSNIQLSEDRITKVAPTEHRSEDVVKPIRISSRKAFPVLPGLFTRVRFSSLPGFVLASLHIEAARSTGCSLSIREVKLDLATGTSTRIDDTTLPKETAPGDEIITLHRLQNTNGPDLQSLNVDIKASASTDGDAPVDMHIKWQTQVDLSRSNNKLTYKWARSPSVTSQTGHPTPTSTQHQGIIFTFTAPSTTKEGEDFKMNIQCVNRSTSTRRFGLVVLPPRKVRSAALTTPQFQATGNDSADVIARMFNTPSTDAQTPVDVLDLNPDVRVGPLPPNASFELDMRFRAMKAGVLDLGTVRILDLDSQQTIDVRELPDIIALEKGA